MLQEYIPGTPETVWIFNGYFDESSTCKVGFTGRKIRQSPPYTGATTLGECLSNPTVHETTVRFMHELGYRGILDIGYRFDARDGEYKLLDVNPRIGATFRLFVGDDGMDVLRALYLDLTGQEVAATTAPHGRRWVVEPLDVSSTIVYRRRGDITLGRWVRSFRGVQEAAWFARDDLRPFLTLWLPLVARPALPAASAPLIALVRFRSPGPGGPGPSSMTNTASRSSTCSSTKVRSRSCPVSRRYVALRPPRNASSGASPKRSITCAVAGPATSIAAPHEVPRDAGRAQLVLLAELAPGRSSEDDHVAAPAREVAACAATLRRQQT